MFVFNIFRGHQAPAERSKELLGNASMRMVPARLPWGTSSSSVLPRSGNPEQVVAVQAAHPSRAAWCSSLCSSSQELQEENVTSWLENPPEAVAQGTLALALKLPR